MGKARFCAPVVLVIGLALVVSGTSAAAASVPVPAVEIDGEPALLSSPLRWADGSLLITIEDLARCLDANFDWNDDQTVWMTKYGNTFLFHLARSGEVLKNSEPIALPVKAQSTGGKLYLPLRFVAENLGATVIWDASAYKVRIITGKRRIPPERIGERAFEAVIAFTDQEKLWLLDGRKPKAEPKQVTDSGSVQICGWSQDGNWLAYKQSVKGEDEWYLWVIAAQGSEARLVDTDPVHGDILWSSQGNCLIYTVRSEKDAANTIKHAEIRPDEIYPNTIAITEAAVLSWAWHPDGDSIAISYPRTETQPPRIERLDLNGNSRNLYTYYDSEPVDPEFNTWAIISLKWSSDGQHLAYHLRKNSGSLTADAVETEVLDLRSGQAISLRAGLKYPNWMDFSPSGDKFAYIAGTGRDVVVNKELELLDLAAQVSSDCGQDGYVDSQPVWLPTGELIYCRGTEAKVAADFNTLPKVMVPKQRVQILNAKGQTRPLTAGPSATADYYPTPSPAGDEMIFLRLERFDQGSLYIQSLARPEPAVEIVRGLRGSPGYYGNYYPQWISVHWF